MLLRLKIVVVILTLLFVFVVLVARVEGAQPQLRILSPEAESVVANTVALDMEVVDFVLDVKPSDRFDHGVIALYLNGKFYTTVASSSATLALPKVGTHRIDAELVHVSRAPVVPSTRQSLYVHNHHKTPFIFVTNIFNGSFVYTDRPVLHVDFRKESFEDQNVYYQVFVDGVVDGDSIDLSDISQYQLKNSLSPGKHTLRLAVYDVTGRPYFPVVDAVIDIVYKAVSPRIGSVVLSSFEPLSFQADISDFSLPLDGYLRVSTGEQEWLFRASEGVLLGAQGTLHNITFELVDLYGHSLVPPVVAQKRFVQLSATPSPSPVALRQSDFIFYTPTVSDQPRLHFILFALVQAVGILVLSFYFHFKHHHE